MSVIFAYTNNSDKFLLTFLNSMILVAPKWLRHSLSGSISELYNMIFIFTGNNRLSLFRTYNVLEHLYDILPM